MDSNNELTVVLHKEIDLIQACITRMARNSFMLKGWTIALIAALIALGGKNADVSVLCVGGIIISICFWYSDAFFLKMEKLYRFKYDWVIEERLNGNRNLLYNLNPYQKEMWLDKQ